MRAPKRAKNGREQVDFDFDFAKRILLDKGSLTPMLILHGDRQSSMVVAPDLAKARSMYETLLRVMAIAENAKAVSFVAEAWTRRLPQRDGESEAAFRKRVGEGPLPSQAEDRQKCAIAAIFWRDDAGELRSEVRQGEILRDADGKITGIKEIEVGDGKGMQSRWANVLPEREPTPTERAKARAALERLTPLLGMQTEEVRRNTPN